MFRARPKPIPPGPGQESVWDYPRPPRIEDTTRHVQIVFNGVTIVDTHHAKRCLETSHPPTYYIPVDGIQMQYLIPTDHRTFCEFKGPASYYSVVVGDRRAENVAWQVTDPTRGYAELKGYVSFYPQPMDACYVGGERVQPQPGNFYGGWITQDVVGPFKGEPGSWGW